MPVPLQEEDSGALTLGFMPCIHQVACMLQQGRMDLATLNKVSSGFAVRNFRSVKHRSAEPDWISKHTGGFQSIKSIWGLTV